MSGSLGRAAATAASALLRWGPAQAAASGGPDGVRDYAAYNVLDDPQLRQGIKDYSNWPTIPQVYLNGEFVGGCDILLQMHQNGDLVEELKKLGIRSALLDDTKDQDSK
ncbi:PREDICTED: glutaredoxin-related protein 5, mitochondrial [Bison bison bison]|uniref:Glutaredoxin-related protein 5, mitochondrial n=1 Tax=Bison bison bison TaxID=43346 RepID=A0A6P3ID18_BISBB|nr:PREDICTED: glutaredoxin-related protein 5, mitochondrial [Bison bison bison]